MQFTRLRLQGFKSFVEPTDLDIPPGMTGIVGPNGCGKSNLVEALRWVMGENSAKRMRGSEMDDVIFGGTATRPSRNLAEVMLELDNSGRSAMAEFNDADSLQVTRSIERGSGSDYRINGRPVRQKDVHWLFADQATGAHSTNLVGQGQIDALIRAKPQDRRQILEEASGTAGLQARRHEAELKLKGAEQNLTRLDDVLKAYDTQLRNLKQQVRQASRYRNLADHIRRAEAALLQLRWTEAEHNAEAVRQALQDAEKRVNELLVIVTRETAVRTDITAELPGLRQTEAAAAAVVQKLTLAREQIESETRRITEEAQAQEQRLAQVAADQEREQSRRADSETSINRLRDEGRALEQSVAAIAAQIPEAEKTLVTMSEEVAALDAALTELLQAAASAEARKESLQQEIETLAERKFILAERRAQLDEQRSALAAEVAARPDLSFASALVDASEKELAKRQQQAQTVEETCREAERMQVQARETLHIAQANATRLKAEAEAIAALLQHHDDEADQVIDLINVATGFEAALAVALGEALTAALDDKAPMHWRSLPPLANTPALPPGVAPITQYIEAPKALARSLSQIGFVENTAAGEKAAPQLQPGQILVSREGWAWRWDGFTVTPQAKTATALRMQQRNRLPALHVDIEKAEADVQACAACLVEADTALAARQAEDQQAREALRAAFAALGDARETYAAQEKEATSAGMKLAAIDDTLRQIVSDLEQIRIRVAVVEDERHALPEAEAQQAVIQSQRAQLAQRRDAQAQRQGESDRLVRERGLAEARRGAVTQEIAEWQSRLDNAAEQIEALAERRAGIEAALDELRIRPMQLAESRAQLLTELSGAEARRSEAADRLIEAEQRLATVEQKLKQDEANLGAAREERVRAEGAVTASGEQFNALRERMAEKLSCAPEELAGIADFGADEAPNLFELEQVLARYLRERENMGPVNLRAEAEAETLQTQIDALQKEKDDLIAAIAKLRQGIGQLNREARERLHAAFEQVNERFQTLFKRLFDGGKARLELIDDEDPLNAGLEIFASPPGKKMQILSLLSGGERSLTALALLFAVFQTNPSPICVLDEAEAALDESNIDRFCSLVSDIARETRTRFLIITHQRLTMARMDRLYGVTMGEKGVSQLVSVDLAGAVALRDGEVVEPAERAEAALQEVRAA
ncbi:MAG: chromosome segregation protein SMC [Alphaproteobacteria bacterium]|nr:chromosome segregation protein SMC [Alphaproteobacteria bacterium]